MSGGSGGGSGARGTGGAAIPSGARKMVQSIKEIVNCPEPEIYAMLKECSMDPSEAVHRLLSQDIFHEVKSKREKKKETKETPEVKSRPTLSSNRGSKGSSDRVGRSAYVQQSADDVGSHAKSFPKKESMEVPALMPNVGSFAASYHSKKSANQNDVTWLENTGQSTFATDVSLNQQPSSVLQNNWFGVTGRRSMADVVKMGRPQGKPSNLPIVLNDTSFPSANAITQDMPHQNIGLNSGNYPLNSNQELHLFQSPNVNVGGASEQDGIHDDWPVDDEPLEENVETVEISADSSIYTETSSLHVDASRLHDNHHFDEMEPLEDNVHINHPATESVRSISLSDRHGIINGSGDDFADDSVNSIPYQSHRPTFEHQAENVNKDISSVAANFQQLSLLKEDSAIQPAEEIPSLIIADHLQIRNPDCSHLSFGSFCSAVPSKHAITTLDTANGSAIVDSPSVHSDDRGPEYHDNGQIRSLPGDNLATTTSLSTVDFDIPSTSHSEDIRNDVLDGSHGFQYNVPSVSGYTLPSTTQPDGTYSFPQSNSHLHNLASFSSLMQHYSSSLPNNSLASTLQPIRNFDQTFSPLLTTQSVPTKYAASMSSISGPTTSMAEAMKQGVFSNHHSSTQALPSTSVPTGPTLLQHLAVHPYSQPTLPLSPFANMISYPVLHQSYAYMPPPSPFQQTTYPGNGAFHQSPAAMHNPGIKYTVPLYKNSVPVAGAGPHSTGSASGYGGAFGASNNMPGSHSLNPSTGSASSTIGFDEVLGSQYNDGSHHLPQQNENLAMWIHGTGGSRAMSAVQPNTFYSFMGQNQISGYRQGQQPSHLGNLSYPAANLYHSQVGISQEHQQNAGVEANNLNNNNPQAPSQQSHQLWQNNY